MKDITPLPETPPADLAERFWQLWASGQPPDVDAFLARFSEMPASETAVVLRIDQRERWHRGERVPAESYLARHPNVAADTESKLDLVFNEYLLRLQCGETPDADEFSRRFPEHADELRAQIDLHSAVIEDSEQTPDCQPGSTDAELEVPGYEILGEIGRGGMGVIYRARQLGLNRTVALKMISAGACASTAERARFRTEAEAVARLQHPNIVQIHDVGSHRGIPYLALEYMEGGTLAQRLGGKPLPPRQSAALIELLARAIHSAHEQGIVHRDLKPANVLFTAATGPQASVAKISDFGLAKDLVSGSNQTSSGAIVGTPGYMAPEQADGQAKYVGPAADVYALGAMLYEVLTGRPPFRGATALETLLQVRTQEPVAPGTLQPGLPRDLVTVCLKALAKEPEGRYTSAAALADDLERYLNDQPVTARPVTRWERAWRRCRRNPVLAGSLAAAGICLLVALVVGGVAALIHRERNRAVAAKEQAEFERERAERAELQLAIRSHLSRAAAFRRSAQVGQRFKCLAELRAALRLGPSPEQRQEIRDEAVAALVLPDFEVAYEWEGWPDGTVAVDFDDSLKRYVRLTDDGTVSLHRLTGITADEIGSFQAPEPSRFSRMWLSPSGEYLAIRHARGERFLRLTVWRLDWERPGAKPHAIFVDDYESVTGDLAVFGGSKAQVLFYYANTELRARFFDAGRSDWNAPLDAAPHAVAVEPGGATVAVDCGTDVLLLDAATGRECGRLPLANIQITCIWGLAWHPDGRRLAVACNDLKVHLWEVATGKALPHAWSGHFENGIHLAFNRTGDRLVSCDWSRQMYFWDATTGGLLLTMPFLDVPRLSRDEDLLGPQRIGNRLRLYRVAARRELRELRSHPGLGRGFVTYPTLDSENQVLATASREALSFFDLASGNELASVRIPFLNQSNCYGFVRSQGWLTGVNADAEPAGTILWPARRDGARPNVLRVGPPRLLSSAGGGGAYTSPDGKVLALEEDNSARILNREGPYRREFRTGMQRDVRGLAVSPDHRFVATCSWHPDANYSIRIWDARTGRHVHDLPIHDPCNFAWFSPDGRWLVTTSFGRCSRLWEVASWREVRTYEETNVAFAGNANACSMALTDASAQIRLIDPATDREIGRLTGPEPTSFDPVAFTPDGSQLIAASRDRKAFYVWDLRAIRQRLAELGLDWDLPPFPPAPSPRPALRVEVDRGWLAHEADFPDPRQAVALFTIGLAFQPLNSEAYLQRGRASARLQRLPEAIADYSMFLSLTALDDRRRAEVLFRRATCYQQCGDESAAERDMVAIAALNVNDLPWPTRAAVRFHTYASKVANGSRQYREPERALLLARKALELDPDNALYHGTVLYREGRWQEAAAVLESAVELAPPTAACSLCFLALCKQRAGDTAAAQACLQRAVRVHNEDGGRPDKEALAQWIACRTEAEAVLGGQGK